MARPATGQVVERDGVRGTTYALRFRAYGKRHYITTGATSRHEAETELANTLADVRRGIWKPQAPAPVIEAPTEEPDFHSFASEWFAAREAEGLAAKTLVDLRWSLTNHLLPHFAAFRLSAITPQAVDQYKVAKTVERRELEEQLAAWQEADPKTRGPRPPRPLSNGSINHTLRHLSQILETAVEYGAIASNPAAGRRRRLKAARPSRPWVEPEQLMTFLDSAPKCTGRALLAILAGTGLRIGEALALRWRDVDLGTGTIHVRDAKTAKGVREVHLSPALREELVEWKVGAEHVKPGDHVVATATGRKHNPSNLRRDVLAKTVAAANVKLEAAGIATIDTLTFHGLRRTYASLRCVCGDDVRYTADQLGHEDPRFTLRAYAQASKRRDRLTRAHREAFDRAVEWAQMGTNSPEPTHALPAFSVEATKNPA